MPQAAPPWLFPPLQPALFLPCLTLPEDSLCSESACSCPQGGATTPRVL